MSQSGRRGMEIVGQCRIGRPFCSLLLSLLVENRPEEKANNVVGLSFKILPEISGLIYMEREVCVLQRRCAAHTFRLHASEVAACNIKESFCQPSECHVSSGVGLGDCL